MKSQSYMTRALQARDPRYATILGKLGYGRADLQAGTKALKRSGPTPEEQLAAAREEYQSVVGKKPFHKWDVVGLRKRIAEARNA